MKWLYGLKTGHWASQSGEVFNTTCAATNYSIKERMAVLQLFPSLNQGAMSQKQRMFSLDQIDVLGSMLDNQPDTYVSQATFVGDTRRKCFFSRVRSCWVDLDLHTQGMALDAQTVNDIRLHCESLQLPQPTLIISSGRGAYLKWILQRAVTDLPAWEAAQSMLVLLFQNFCSDKRARDACRVFRMLGTINSKVDDAERQRVAAIDGAGEEVAFETLALALEHARQFIDLPSNISSNEINCKQRKPRSDVLNRMGKRLLHAAERGSVDELKLYSRLREPILMSGKFTVASLGWSRFCDLRDLYIQRGGIPVGERDTAMFWMLNCLGHAGIVTPSNFREEVLGLLYAFPQGASAYDPLNDGSLQTLQDRLFKTHQIKSSVRKEAGEPSMRMVNASKLLYRPGNAFLIDAFDITEQEQSSLRVLIGAKEKQRRADVKAPGRSDRREQRHTLKEKVAAWLQDRDWQCNNISALARDLGEVHGRVWRAVQACLKERLQDDGLSSNVSRDAGAVVCTDPTQETATGDSKWSVPASIFFGVAPQKHSKKQRSSDPTAQRYQKPRSILGSYGSKHAQSLEALRMATARPRSAGIKHWMPAFTQDIADYYRRHAQWPNENERAEMMNWHRQKYAAGHPDKRAHAGQGRQQITAKHVFMTELTSNLSSKSKYLSTKDLYIQHYGEQGAARWESMTAVQRIHASIEMEREIWERAKNKVKDQTQPTKQEIQERWLASIQHSRAVMKRAKTQEENRRRLRITRATGGLRSAWSKMNSVTQERG